MFVVMPLFAVMMTRVVSLNRAVTIALIALSISPIPPILPNKVTKSGGLAPYGLGLMVTAATFSIGFAPLAVYLIGKYFNRPFAMGPGTVAELIVLSVLTPLATGIVFRKATPTIAERIADPIAHIAGIVLLIGVLCLFAFILPKTWALMGNGTLVALIAFAIPGLTIGHFFGGSRLDERITLALSTECRHPALALAIAGVNIPEERRVISAVVLYILISALVTIPYIAWQRKGLGKSQLRPNFAHSDANETRKNFVRPAKLDFPAVLKSPIVIRGLPGLVRIIEFHVLNDVERIASQILLVDNPVVANHEGLYAGDAIIGGCGYKCKAANHRSLDHVVEFP
jgi:BASS family bile acid:Na+ symporter